MTVARETPHIYRCIVTLHETTYFSTREVSSLYQTEPFIGHIALCYALGLAPSRYFNRSTVHYKADLAALNARGIYVTPATVLAQPRFHLEQFNAQPETYWSAMGNNLLVTVPAGTWAVKAGPSWYVHDGTTPRPKKLGTENRPQVGRIRALGIGTRAVFYIISHSPYTPPRYIRLGKWMSKARISTTPITPTTTTAGGDTTSLLVPADLPSTLTILAADQLAVKPTPLLRNARVRGACYQLPAVPEQAVDPLLPVGMRFNVEDIP